MLLLRKLPQQITDSAPWTAPPPTINLRAELDVRKGKYGCTCNCSSTSGFLTYAGRKLTEGLKRGMCGGRVVHS